jgi:transglutaminase-like putative cysteine protease
MKSILYIIIIGICPFLLIAQNYSISDLDVLSLLQGEISIVRSDHLQVEVHTKDKVDIHRKMAITYLEDPGHGLSPKLYYNDLSDIKNFELRIYDSSGEEVMEYKKRDLRDEARLSYSIYTDSRVQYFEVGEFDYPLTVEYEYEKRLKGIMSFTPWIVQNFNQKVMHAQCDILLPEDIKLYYRFENLEIQPEVSDLGNEKKYTWHIQDLPPIEYETHAPHPLNILPTLQYGLDQFEVEKFQGSYENWATFGAFLQQFYDEARELPEDIKKEIHEITAGNTGRKEKIKLLYDYLQDNTRYVSVQIGVGGWKTYDAEYVAEHQYGDCKALSNYLSSMLSEAGIESYPLIIERDQKAYAVAEDFVFNQFNHAILYIPSEKMFVECTANSGPEGYVGSDIQSRKALLVDSFESHLISMPSTPFHKNKKITLTHIQLMEDGPSGISSKEKYLHHRHEDWRTLKDRYNPRGIKKTFRENYPLTIASLDSFSMEVAKDKPLATLHYHLKTIELGINMGKRIFLKLNPLYRSTISLPEDDKRVNPIRIYKNGVDSNVIWYHMPDGYTLESMPDSPISIETKWGNYQLSFKFIDSRTLKVNRQFEFYKIEEDADHYNDIKSFFDEVQQADSNTKIVLVKK